VPFDAGDPYLVGKNFTALQNVLAQFDIRTTLNSSNVPSPGAVPAGPIDYRFTAFLPTQIGFQGLTEGAGPGAVSFTPPPLGSVDYGPPINTVSEQINIVQGPFDPAFALDAVDKAIAQVSGALQSLGAATNEIATQRNFVKSLTDALAGGVGVLVDADLSNESANLEALQTRQQLGVQSLSIANREPAAILPLFR
jgi:hypothetical protein